jgi:hypothetical protein
MGEFSKKLVAVLNEKVEPGRLMNALAHMAIGFGASIKNKEELRLMDYIDSNQGNHSNISEMPFIVLKANSNKIRTLRKAAINNNIEFTDFTSTMTVGTYKEQIEKTKATKEEDLEYHGIILFGEWELVSELTKKFSLWK